MGEEHDVSLDAVLAAARTRRPVSTYRLQLHGGFGLEQAEAIVPYLHRLGITDLYASPLLRARTGSTHGYDVVDHGRVDEAIGGEAALRALSCGLHARGMGLLIDVVPNHVGIGWENARWMDVLENGEASLHSHFFDIDWAPLKPELAGKILLPILGDHYGHVLERGELSLSFDLESSEDVSRASFRIRYWEERLPVAPRSYIAILRHRLASLEEELGAEHVHLQELLSILTALENLPPRGPMSSAKLTERHREKEVVKRRLAALVESAPAVARHVRRAVLAFNGLDEDERPLSEEPSRFDLLDALLEEQAYRVAYWRVAGEEINYRRFFDINTLAAIRQEDPVVFEETHRLYLQLLDEGVIDGMRIDHPDGLYDPAEYLRKLQEEVVARTARRLGADPIETRLAYRRRLDDDVFDTSLRPLFVVVEKILSRKERVPDRWLIDGTTGYEFLNLLNGLFVERANAARLEATWRAALGRELDFLALVRANKRLIMKTAMVSEINVLAHRLSALSERSRRTRDFTLNSLRRALVETVSAFPVYRTYVDGSEVDERDRQYIEQAVAQARASDDELVGQTFEFLRSILLMEPVVGGSEEVRREHLAFVMKLQQVTGPVMAKGLEDTTFYVYNRLVSLNEVGGEPEHFGVPIETFHRQNAARAQRFPASLLTTSTHDTKRSEDVRARIDVLSELPDAWERFLEVAREANRGRRVEVRGRLAPDAAEEVLFYQTLLGAVPVWPLPRGERDAFIARMVAYMQKATKEAKVNNSWTNHEPAYDEAIARFVTSVLEAGPDDPFHEEMRRLHRRIARVGTINALSQQLLKITSPGVPDLYQGTESWDLSLVDPDNRRPVDFEARAKMLDAIAAADRAALCDELSRRPEDPRSKLFLTHVALETRRADPSLFVEGAYVPLDVVGPRARHVVAFARVLRGRVALVAVPRLVAAITGERSPWAETFVTLPDEVAEAIPEGDGLRDAFSGERRRVIPREGATAHAAEALFARFPLALLVST